MGSVGLLANAEGGLPLGRLANHFDTAPAAGDDGGVLDWIWGVLLGGFEKGPTKKGRAAKPAPVHARSVRRGG